MQVQTQANERHKSTFYAEGAAAQLGRSVDGWSEEEGSEHNYHSHRRRRMTPKCILFALQLLLLLSGWDMIALFLPFNPNTIYLGAESSRLSGELVVQSKFRK